MLSNAKKSEFLGISYGTACGKLRKNILFMLAQKCNMDTCFRCNRKIETVNDISIEHKLPWEGRSVELFWDLENIAFSHVKCNRPHIVGNKRTDGLAWCYKCKESLSVSSFYKGSNGRQYCSLCKEHDKLRTKELRAKEKRKYD